MKIQCAAIWYRLESDVRRKLNDWNAHEFPRLWFEAWKTKMCFSCNRIAMTSHPKMAEVMAVVAKMSIDYLRVTPFSKSS